MENTNISIRGTKRIVAQESMDSSFTSNLQTSKIEGKSLPNPNSLPSNQISTDQTTISNESNQIKAKQEPETEPNPPLPEDFSSASNTILPESQTSLSSSQPLQDLSTKPLSSTKHQLIIQFEDLVTSLNQQYDLYPLPLYQQLYQQLNQLSLYHCLSQVSESTLLSLYPSLKSYLLSYQRLVLFEDLPIPTLLDKSKSNPSCLQSSLDLLDQFLSYSPALLGVLLILSTPSFSILIYDEDLISLLLACHQHDISQYMKYMDILSYCSSHSIRKSMYQNKLYQQKIKSYFSAIQSSLLSIHSLLFQVQLSSSFYQQLDRIYTNCFYEYPPSLFSSPSLFPSMIQNRLLLFWMDPTLQQSILESILNNLPLFQETRSWTTSTSSHDSPLLIDSISLFLIQSIQGDILYTKETDSNHFEKIQSHINYLFNLFLSKTPIKLEKNEVDPYSTFLKVFIHDLFILLDNPFYPICSSFLYILVHKLILFITNYHTSSNPSSASANNPIKENGSYGIYFKITVDLLSTLIIRIAKDRRFMEDHPLTLPQPVENYNQQGLPGQEGEVIGCKCGRGVVPEDIMLDCDRCHRWFHASCAGIDTHLYTAESLAALPWFCHDCQTFYKMSTQIEDLEMNLHVDQHQSAPSSPPPLPSPFEHQQLLLNYITSLLITNTSDHIHQPPYLLYNPYYHARQYNLYAWQMYYAHQEQPLQYLQTQLSVPTFFDAHKYPLPSLPSLPSLCCSLLFTTPLYLSAPSYLKQFVDLFPSSARPIRLQRYLFTALCTLIQAIPSLLHSKAVFEVLQQGLKTKYVSIKEQVFSAFSLLCVHHWTLIPAYVHFIEESIKDPTISIRKTLYRALSTLYEQREAMDDETMKKIVFLLLDSVCTETEKSAVEVLRTFFVNLWIKSTSTDYPRMIHVLGPYLAKKYKYNSLDGQFETLVHFLQHIPVDVESESTTPSEMKSSNSKKNASSSIESSLSKENVRSNNSDELASFFNQRLYAFVHYLMEDHLPALLSPSTTHHDLDIYHDFLILYYLSARLPLTMKSHLSLLALYLREPLPLSDLYPESIQVLLLDLIQTILPVATLDPLYPSICTTIVTMIKSCKLLSTIEKSIQTLTAIMKKFQFSPKPLFSLLQLFFSYLPAIEDLNATTLTTQTPLIQRCLCAIASILSYYPLSTCSTTFSIRWKSKTLTPTTVATIFFSFCQASLAYSDLLSLPLQTSLCTALIHSTTLNLSQTKLLYATLSSCFARKEVSFLYSLVEALYHQYKWLLVLMQDPSSYPLDHAHSYIFDFYTQLTPSLQNLLKHPQPQLRFLTLLLLQLLIRNNDVYSMNYVYELTLFQVDPHEQARSISCSLLLYMYEKYKDVIHHDVYKAILESAPTNVLYNQQLVYSFPTCSGKESIYQSLYQQLYAKQRQERYSFLHHLLTCFDHQDHSQILYILTILSSLKYQYVEDILYLLYCLNLYKSKLITPLELQFQGEDDSPDYTALLSTVEDSPSFFHTLSIALTLLSFKHYLRVTYDIKNDQCHQYDPQTITHTQETPLPADGIYPPYTYLDLLTLRLTSQPSEFVSLETSTEKNIDAVRLLWSFLKQDENDVSLKNKPKSKKKGKRRSLKKVEEDWEDEESDDSMLLESSSWKRRSSLRLAKKKKVQDFAFSDDVDDEKDSDYHLDD